MEVEIERLDARYQFEASSEGQTVQVTASPNMAGDNRKGLRPMELILSALGSCMAIDVLNILYKQRQQVDSFKVSVKGVRSEGIPAVFTRIDLMIQVAGEVEKQRLQKAIAMSVNRHCSVYHTLSPQVDIHCDYTLNHGC